MKTRNGFVSNSSSCSFIVHDAKAAMNAFKSEFGKKYNYKDMPYGIEDIIFYLHGKKNALEKIKNYVECSNTIMDSYHSDDETHMLELSLCTLMSIPAKMLKGVTSIEVSADDCNHGNVMIVRLLRAFFDGCLLTTEDTGDKWSGLDEDDFTSKLLNKVISSNA